MKKSTNSILIFSCIILLSSCASYYRAIEPKKINYSASVQQNGIDFFYRYNVLEERGNTKNAKKELKNGISVVAVKITNNTDSTFTIGRDVQFFSNNVPIYPMEPLAIRNTIQQSVVSYIPYALFTFLSVTISTPGNSTTFPVGYGLGPALTIGNMATAGIANTNLLKELNNFNIWNREIQKGETVYGIIGLRERGFNPLSLRFFQK